MRRKVRGPVKNASALLRDPDPRGSVPNPFLSGNPVARTIGKSFCRCDECEMFQDELVFPLIAFDLRLNLGRKDHVQQ